MMNELLSYIGKYSMPDLEKRYEEARLNSYVKIGFLGEFSSGKSSLINAMLSRDILPVMDIPTSKSIVHIIADKNFEDIKYFLHKTGDDKEEIDFSTFHDYALGKKNGTVEVRCKPNELLKESIFIVDTPGISSIDQTDADVTYGYLPFLDGAIICIDVSKGTVNKSLIEFLKLPVVNQLSKYFVFALTKSDLKNNKDAEEIRSNIVKTLSHESNAIKFFNPEKQTVLVSTMRNNVNNVSGNFAKTYTEIISNQSKEMRLNRTRKELIDVRDELASRLDKLSKIIELSLPDIRTQLNEYENKRKNIDYEENDARIKNREIAQDISKQISTMIHSYKEHFASAQNRDDVVGVATEFRNEIRSKIEGIIIDKYNISKSINISTSNIVQRITNIMSNADLISSIAQVVIIVATTVATSGAGGVAMGTIKVAKGVKVVSAVSKFGKVAKYFIKFANTIDIDGKIISKITSKVINNAVEEEANKVEKEITSEVENILNLIVNDEVIQPLRNRYRALQEATNNLYIEKEKSEIECRNKQGVIYNDIKALQNIKLD